MTKLAITLITMMFLVAFAVQAETADPTITLLTTSQSSCPCKSLTYPIEIQNNAVFDDWYEISANIFADYIQLSENPLYVPGGEKRTVYVYITLPCEYFGTFEPYLYFHSHTFNLDYSIPLGLEILPCYDYEISYVDIVDNSSIESHDEEYSFCSGESNSMNILVSNMAEFDNLYYFDLEGPDWITLSQENAIVPENESRLVILNVDAPEDTIEKESIIISVFGQRGEEIKKLETEVSISECFDLELIIDSMFSGCQCGSEKYELILKNLGEITEKINLKLEGPEWVSLEKKGTIVVAGQQKIIDIYAEIPCDVKGKSKITIFAEIDGKEHIKTETKFVIDVEKEGKCTGDVVVSEKKSSKLIYWIIIIVVLGLFGVGYYFFKHHESEDFGVVKSEPKKVSKKEKKELDDTLSDVKENLPGHIGKWVMYIVVLLVVLVGLTALGIYFNSIVEFLKPYWLYLVIGVVLVGAFFLFSMEKKPIEKTVIKKVEKVSKKSKKDLQFSFDMKKVFNIVIILVVLAGIIFVGYYYKLHNLLTNNLGPYALYGAFGLILLFVVLVSWKIFEKK